MIETNLYFGQSKLDGGTVGQQEWNGFVEQHISKVFAEGSTIVPATGNWYDTGRHQVIKEPSFMVIAINKMSPKLTRQIDSLRNRYKSLFQQQSVLRVDKKVRAKLF